MAKDSNGLHIQTEEEFALQLEHAEADLGTFEDADDADDEEAN